MIHIRNFDINKEIQSLVLTHYEFDINHLLTIYSKMWNDLHINIKFSYEKLYENF